jgi:hypothetical protein
MMLHIKKGMEAATSCFAYSHLMRIGKYASTLCLFSFSRAMVYKLEVRNVDYQVMPDEVRNTLQALQVADGLQSIRLDRAEGWKEQVENLIRKWGPDFLCQMVLMFTTEEQAKLCARVPHGRWIAGLSKPGNKTCSLERFLVPAVQGLALHPGFWLHGSIAAEAVAKICS